MLNLYGLKLGSGLIYKPESFALVNTTERGVFKCKFSCTLKPFQHFYRAQNF